MRQEYDPTDSAAAQTATTQHTPRASTPGPVAAAAPTLTINVIGTPAPQGSHRAFVVNGRPVLTQDSKKTKPWRQDVATAVREILATEDWWAIPAGAVRVDITYYIARPRYHYRTGKHADQLRPDAPAYVDKKPDKDKLDRATFDALTVSGVIRDDAQIADGRTVKRYADGATGARITISALCSVPALGSSPVAGAGTDNTPHHPCSGRPAEGEAAGRPGHTTREGALF